MKGHFLGQDRNSGGASAARGSSLAVRQFVDLISGWVPVHTPTTPFRVEAVEVEERYCLKCYAVHNFDVALGARLHSADAADRRHNVEQIDYEFSVNYKGQTLTLVSAPKGTPLWAVLECARHAHVERYRRVCREVRLAGTSDRPPRWVKNPIPSKLGEIWMLVVVWDEVPGVKFQVPSVEVCDE